ncbi:23S rRNA (pseudouridine1915-N3)-methyltransferase [Caminicella sporogenes DSM 14501]|uniref:Ribosomal RNA large subunit methyltransferase H n=1 Tax=Caminicella sporogenes DSM 14501 TaxID=1121266 RepID=A0A1M6NHE8_9FIRM|nr:23S rRNA (pseudouridine(1915)-N(3))-methyltransferase RlmH [Caminicella sporogenes]RKD22200.1 23S rRNA (pseudouridine(1915)-N(3))-methyltransferase RlmH [Caminicella sporogenes]WIF95818.1 23S rRNA (pseudouridine(1915)-N(3))-methyltransferase RlmH [Caminicella sporogenes]SHJ95171.1 23S rRNA (pseudouridine1915-N3)-methyltransferase [Caminicella sporogenes DSM 14501]
MNISIISVGKIKEKYLKDAIKEYDKRLSRYCRLKYIEVSDEKAPENLSNAEIELVKNREGERILKNIKEDSYVIALDIQGKMLSSEEFAKKLDNLAIQGKSNIAFVIGGSLGLSKEVLKRANYRLSFSPMTFPHQLMKVILMEQIYRGFRINKGQPYHK